MVSELRKILKSDFQFKVLSSAGKIPRGKVASYREAASLAGHKKACRAAGNALAKNPCLIKIPCHRVVCSSGALGGYKKGKAAKRRLLEKEGIIFDRKGRIPGRFFVSVKGFKG